MSDDIWWYDQKDTDWHCLPAGRAALSILPVSAMDAFPPLVEARAERDRLYAESKQFRRMVHILAMWLARQDVSGKDAAWWVERAIARWESEGGDR